MSLSTVSSIVTAGNAYFLSANTTSQSVTVTSNNGSLVNVLVENLDNNNDIFVTWSAVPGSTATAVLPAAGSPQVGVAINENSGRIIQVAAPQAGATQANIAVITFSSTANVIITPVA